MEPDVLAVSIPIIFIIATALVLVAAFYYKSREKQLLIEKGLTPEAIKEFFESKKDPNRLIKIGVVTFAFGLGLGFGMILKDSTSKDYWIPLFLFTFTGIGFIGSGLVSRKFDVKN